jgi:hypothetical protein
MPKTDVYAGPLQRKKRSTTQKKTRTYGKTGHVVEGRRDLYKRAASEQELHTRRTLDPAGSGSRHWGGYGTYDTQRVAANKRDKDLKTQYTAADEARSRLRTIADPEAGKAEQRKRAARRRMRGRMGTILSPQSTLGAKGKLG